MAPDGQAQPDVAGRHHGTAIVILVVATVAALAGAFAFTIHRLHALRPDQPLTSAVALALPLLGYLGVAGIIIVLLGRVASGRIERQAERLVAAEEQFRAYVENTSEWVWALDLKGTILYSNPAVRDILGYEPEELIGTDVRPLVESAAREATERLLPEVIAGRQRWNGVVRKFLHKNGEWRYLESTGMPVVDDDGRVVGFRGAERDITRRKLAEAALRRSEERFQLAARATNDVLWDWDFTTGSIWRNDNFTRVFGFGESAGMTAERDALLHPADRPRVVGSLEEFLASSRDAWAEEYRFRRGDGSYAWVLDRGIVVRNDQGRPLRMIGSMLDITERKEAERLKSDFVSFVSHQLRTPLSGMNWMLELAADAEGLPDQAREYIVEAQESGARLVRLVNDLLDIARLESGRTAIEPEPVDLGQVTRSVVTELQALASGKGQALTLDGLDAPAVNGDPQLLRQVVTNLVSNAIKYTPDGGRIDVRMTRTDGLVEWLIKDNGMGIPPAARGRLFEKFYRADNAVATETEGTGLGLHLVRLIVEQTGGHVRVESEEGEGATFAFVLPVWRQPGAQA